MWIKSISRLKAFLLCLTLNLENSNRHHDGFDDGYLTISFNFVIAVKGHDQVLSIHQLLIKSGRTRIWASLIDGPGKLCEMRYM